MSIFNNEAFIGSLTEITIKDDVITGAWLVDGSDPVFLGHYPSNPVLPGIYTFEIVSNFIRHYFHQLGLKVVVNDVKTMRFMAPFVPYDNMKIEAQLKKSEETGKYTVVSRVYKNDKKAASLKLNIEVKSDHVKPSRN